MYEAVYTYPDGKSTVARVAKTAAEYGFDGVVVRNGAGERAEYDPERVAERYGLDVVDGIEVRADEPQSASGSVGQLRRSHTVLAVRGGTNRLNRFAVEHGRVDVLASPLCGDGDVNHVLAKAAVENGVRFEFDLGPVLRESGGARVRAIQSLRKLREIVEHYDAPYVVSASPRSHLELRAPRELVAVGERVGFSREWIECGLRGWESLAERNRRIDSESFIEPGIERGRYEKEP